MKILLTGGNGLVGKLVRDAKENNYEISIVSRKIFSSITFYSSLEKFLKHNNFDLLIHCSAATPFNTDFDLIPEVNKNIDEELCRFFERGSIKHLVYLSTMAIYGEIKVDVLNEKLKINNPNLYGYSKYLGENLVKQTCSKNNILLSIIRLPGVVGKGMSNIFLEDFMNQF